MRLQLNFFKFTRHFSQLAIPIHLLKQPERHVLLFGHFCKRSLWEELFHRRSQKVQVHSYSMDCIDLKTLQRKESSCIVKKSPRKKANKNI